MQGVYSELVRRFKVASDGPAAALASAAVMPMPAQQAAVAARPSGRPSPSVTDVAGLTKVFAAAGARAAAPSAAVAAPVTGASPAGAPIFNSLFSDQARRTAVDPMVVSLWTVPASQPDAAPAARTANPQVQSSGNNGTAAASFDLFQDARPNARQLFGGSS
jgi:hypothetical protein